MAWRAWQERAREECLSSPASGSGGRGVLQPLEPTALTPGSATLQGQSRPAHVAGPSVPGLQHEPQSWGSQPPARELQDTAWGQGANQGSAAYPAAGAEAVTV